MMYRVKTIMSLMILMILLLAVVGCGEAEEGNTSSAEATPTEVAFKSMATMEGQADLPEAVAVQSVNLREGPGTNYTVVGNLQADERVLVVGKNQDGSWFQIDLGGERAWISADSNLITLEEGDASNLPVVETNAPSVAYDLSNPQVNLLLNQIPLVIHNVSDFTCASHGGFNNMMQIAEGNVVGPHAGDFVYKNNNVLFRYTQGSFRMIREAEGATFEGGVESIPFDEAVQMFQNGEIVWTGSLGQSPGRGVTGCDPAAQ